jgi:uncharacterized protein (DUF427 family)
MTDKRARVPGPDHPITIERNPARVVVVVAGQVIAETREAVTLREASYPPVHYVPRKDVDMTALVRSTHVTYCPYKGDCTYFSISIGGERSLNAVWTYEAPYPAVTEIRGHLAFYPERVDAIEERLEAHNRSRDVVPVDDRKTCGDVGARCCYFPIPSCFA